MFENQVPSSFVQLGGETGVKTLADLGTILGIPSTISPGSSESFEQ